MRHCCDEFLERDHRKVASRELSDGNKKNNGACLYGVLAIAFYVLSLLLGLLAIVYLGAWFVLGFGVGLYLNMMTFLYQVRISTTPGTTLFQFGLVFFSSTYFSA